MIRSQKITKRIVIIGGGFAGLHVAKFLKNSDYQVTLVAVLFSIFLKMIFGL